MALAVSPITAVHGFYAGASKTSTRKTWRTSTFDIFEDDTASAGTQIDDAAQQIFDDSIVAKPASKPKLSLVHGHNANSLHSPRQSVANASDLEKQKVKIESPPRAKYVPKGDTTITITHTRPKDRIQKDEGLIASVRGLRECSSAIRKARPRTPLGPVRPDQANTPLSDIPGQPTGKENMIKSRAQKSGQNRPGSPGKAASQQSPYNAMAGSRTPEPAPEKRTRQTSARSESTDLRSGCETMQKSPVIIKNLLRVSRDSEQTWLNQREAHLREVELLIRTLQWWWRSKKSRGVNTELLRCMSTTEDNQRNP